MWDVEEEEEEPGSIVAYASAHVHSFTDKKISQQQYRTAGNDLSSFLQTSGSNSKLHIHSGLCVYVHWTGYNSTQVSVAIHCVSSCGRYLECCDGASHDLEPSTDGVRDP